MTGPTFRERTALLLGRAAGVSARRLGRGGGTALPGLIAASVAPSLVERLSAEAGQGVITVTGTNGKTTTTHLLAAIMRAHGVEPITNPSGSNLERGLITAYVRDAGPSGRIPDGARRVGLFEVDEAVLPRLFARIRPRVAVFLNLFRDQLDRYGEVDSVAEGWASMLRDPRATAALVLNADDPSIAQLAMHGRGGVRFFGIDDPAVALAAGEHASDARFCRCGGRFAYDAVYMGHVGRWRCPSCGVQRPEPSVVAQRVVLGVDGTHVDLLIAGEAISLDLPLAGLYSVYNALAAATAAHAMGVPPATIAAALASAGPAFGRQEQFSVEGRTVRVLLAKNPTGLNEILRTLIRPEPVHVLAMLNDGIQDGQDVSWIYDADIEMLAARDLVLVCSGDRADDFALRWHLAGIDPVAVDVNAEAALTEAIRRTPNGGRLEVIATYTAMIAVREALARRAGVPSYWDEGHR